MSEKFRDRYRIPSARLQKWDYAWNAAYFITICTQHRICYFGDIVNGKMELLEIGRIVQKEWLKTFELRPDMNLQMGSYVVMPNHFHGIVIIGKNKYNQRQKVSGAVASPPSLPVPRNQFGPQSKNLASVVRGFKIGVTKRARLIHADFAWQSRYHDHIIRDEKSFRRISEYIDNNPFHWDEDVFR